MKSGSPFLRTALILLGLIMLSSVALHAANDRPLLYGMNPTPMDWWGYNKFVWDPILFNRMAEAGCTVARIGVNWDTIERVPGQRDWSEIDRWVDYCLDNNIEPLILINSTPTWALPDYVDPIVSYAEARYPPAIEHAETFEEWVYDLVRRYRGRVRYYEFWNEANGYGWYTALLNPPSYGRADLYTPWMIRAYKSLKLSDPTAMMSTTGIDDGGMGHAASYLEGIYQHGGKGYFDAVADHPYTMGAGFQPFKMDNIRQKLDSHGDTHVPIWITEFGFSMNPNNYPTYQQWMTEYFDILTQDEYDYVTIATWHTANEFPWEFGYGLMNSDLSAKPPYNTFKNYPKPQRPSISGIQVQHLTPSSVRIRYNTNMASTSLVMYGKDKTYGNISARSLFPVTSHQVDLIGLSPSTQYNFRIRAGAVQDGDSFSQNHTFTTNSGPVVNITTGPFLSNISHSSAVVTWTTDVPATTRVEYSKDFHYNNFVVIPGLKTEHMAVISGLDSSTNYQYRVRSTGQGYAEAVKEGGGFTTMSPAGVLINGGFEMGNLTGWIGWGEVDGIQTAPWFGSATPRSGQYFLGTAANWGFKNGGVYQRLAVEPDRTYMAETWIHTYQESGDAGAVASRIGIDPTGGNDPTSSSIVWSPYTSSQNQWSRIFVTAEVTAPEMTVFLQHRQGGYAIWSINSFDDVAVYQIVPSVADSIKLPEGWPVALAESTVTAALGNVFYVTDSNRVAGLRVESTVSVSPGQRVLVYGQMSSRYGERMVQASSVGVGSSGPVPAPLHMRASTIGGTSPVDGLNIPGATGLYNSGLLIAATGKVTHVGSGFFYLDDGTGLSDGSPYTGVRVLAQAGWMPALNATVTVTGISSRELVGGQIIRVIRARGASDIKAH